jgi:hypothetical protein
MTGTYSNYAGGISLSLQRFFPIYAQEISLGILEIPVFDTLNSTARSFK